MVFKCVSIFSFPAVVSQPSPSIISSSGLKSVVAKDNFKELEKTFALLFRSRQSRLNSWWFNRLMWHTCQTFPFGSGGIHSSAAFWKCTATCKRGCWQAQQKRLRQFAQRWSLVKEMTSWNTLAQRNMSLFVDQVDHQFTLEKFKFAIKRCVCVGGN